jgi:hypothetical protein
MIDIILGEIKAVSKLHRVSHCGKGSIGAHNCVELKYTVYGIRPTVTDVSGRSILVTRWVK